MTNRLAWKKNLLEETTKAIWDACKTGEDIIHIGVADGSCRSCTWAEFAEMANRDYDSGYGGAEVLMALVIVFKDGSWLERAEYDGSEWWEYKRAPNIPQNPQPLHSVFEGGINDR